MKASTGLCQREVAKTFYLSRFRLIVNRGASRRYLYRLIHYREVTVTILPNLNIDALPTTHASRSRRLSLPLAWRALTISTRWLTRRFKDGYHAPAAISRLERMISLFATGHATYRIEEFFHRSLRLPLPAATWKPISDWAYHFAMPRFTSLRLLECLFYEVSMPRFKRMEFIDE